MFSPHKYLYPCVILLIINSQPSTSELALTQTLVLYSPGEPEYLDVLVRRVNDSLTLVCEQRGDVARRNFVWNYVPSNQSQPLPDRPFQLPSTGPSITSTVHRSGLQVLDSGLYMCSVPPFSVTKYIAVQNKGLISCARGAFTCGARCVLPAYVCDGRSDCARGEDEAAHMCHPRVCSRPDKLNCSSGRCISSQACCRGAAAQGAAESPLCHQPDCCNEYIGELPHDGGGLLESGLPPLYEDHRAPDDYGFIQSTIYTVTACALIFMIAVVLLVSAICKMQMKRAALRTYTHADRAARQHYSVQYHQAHTFPPCYEASRLLEQDAAASPRRAPASPRRSPAHFDQQRTAAPEPATVEPPRGLARLTSIFSSRYRQVPTHPDMELTSVPPLSTPTSPSHSHSPSLPMDYRSPTYCDLNTDLIFTPEEMGRELNYMATPVEFFRRRTMRRNTLERVMDQLDRQRLTLQLGRFQVSIPRLGRTDPRPDTPVAESRATLGSLDLLRIDTRDTYTLNGRTIRLLGADIQHPHPGNPPSYTEAVRYKLYGPPPEYLSREGLNRQGTDVDQEATTNIEMPPQYDDLRAGGGAGDVNGNSGLSEISEVNGNSDVCCGDSGRINDNTGGLCGNIAGIASRDNEHGVISDALNGNENSRLNRACAITDSDNANGNNVNPNNVPHPNIHASPTNMETLSSIIDNLPAIDSDVNANDGDISASNDHVIRDNVAIDVIAN